MTDYYVYSGATGGIYDGTTEGTAWQNISDATGLSNGDRLLVHHQHSQTGWTDVRSWNPGSSTDATNPIICMSCDWGNSYAYTPGAVETALVGTQLTSDTTLGGKHVIWMGIDFRGEDLLIFANPAGITIIDGLIGTSRSNGTAEWTEGTQAASMTMINTDLEMHSTAASVHATAQDGLYFKWRGGSLIAGTNTLSNLFTVNCNTQVASYDIRGVDLSVAGGFTNLVRITGSTIGAPLHGELGAVVRLTGCKMPASFTLVNNDATVFGEWRVELVGCDDGTLTDPAYNYRHEEASGKSETVLTHYRTGGADDGFQANAYSLKVDANVSRTKKHFRQAAVKIPLAVYVGTTGSKTFKVHFAHNGTGSGTGGLYQDNEVWLESEGPPETTATALMAVKTSCSTYGGTVSDLTNETGETWTGTGVGTKQSVEIAYTTQLEGMAYFTLCFAPEAAETIYVDPKVEIL